PRTVRAEQAAPHHERVGAQVAPQLLGARVAEGHRHVRRRNERGPAHRLIIIASPRPGQRFRQGEGNLDAHRLPPATVPHEHTRGGGTAIRAPPPPPPPAPLPPPAPRPAPLRRGTARAPRAPAEAHSPRVSVAPVRIERVPEPVGAVLRARVR